MSPDDFGELPALLTRLAAEFGDVAADSRPAPCSTRERARCSRWHAAKASSCAFARMWPMPHCEPRTPRHATAVRSGSLSRRPAGPIPWHEIVWSPGSASPGAWPADCVGGASRLPAHGTNDRTAVMRCAGNGRTCRLAAEIHAQDSFSGSIQLIWVICNRLRGRMCRSTATRGDYCRGMGRMCRRSTRPPTTSAKTPRPRLRAGVSLEEEGWETSPIG